MRRCQTSDAHFEIGLHQIDLSGGLFGHDVPAPLALHLLLQRRLDVGVAEEDGRRSVLVGVLLQFAQRNEIVDADAVLLGAVAALPHQRLHQRRHHRVYNQRRSSPAAVARADNQAVGYAVSCVVVATV